LATESKCVECGGHCVEERVAPVAHQIGKRSVRIDRDHHLYCPDCGNISYRGSMLSDNQLMIAEQIRRQDGLLTPLELKAIRSKYGLSQSDIEKILTIGSKTWVRWERGKVVQGSAADQMIRLIAKRPDVLRELMQNASVKNAKTMGILDAHDREIEERVAEVLRANLHSGKVHHADDFERAAKAVAEEARKAALAG